MKEIYFHLGTITKDVEKMYNILFTSPVNKAGFTATEVVYGWAGAVMKNTNQAFIWAGAIMQKNAKNAEKSKVLRTDGSTDIAGCRVTCTRLKS